jgi:hypothetical protein
MTADQSDWPRCLSIGQMRVGKLPGLHRAPGEYRFSKWGVFVDLETMETIPDGHLIIHSGWCPLGRMMVMDKTVGFLDPEGTVWVAWKGMCFNGRSMPRTLWTIVSPFTGRGRDASAFHDSGCITRDVSSWHVHKMFYRCLRAKGVNPFLAGWEWFGVFLRCWFRPRWKSGYKVPKTAGCPCDVVKAALDFK